MRPQLTADGEDYADRTLAELSDAAAPGGGDGRPGPGGAAQRRAGLGGSAGPMRPRSRPACSARLTNGLIPDQAVSRMPENTTPMPPAPRTTGAARSSSTCASWAAVPARCGVSASRSRACGARPGLIGVPEGAPLDTGPAAGVGDRGRARHGHGHRAAGRRVRAVPRPGLRGARRRAAASCSPTRTAPRTRRPSEDEVAPDRRRPARRRAGGARRGRAGPAAGRRCAGRTVPGCARPAGSGSTSCPRSTRTTRSTRGGRRSCAGRPRHSPTDEGVTTWPSRSGGCRAATPGPAGRSGRRRPRRWSRCPNRACGELKLPHTACPNCGQYDGKQVLVRLTVASDQCPLTPTTAAARTSSPPRSASTSTPSCCGAR